MLPIVLMNGAQLEVSQEEIREYITQLLIPNPDWHHSGLLTREEVERYLKDEASPEDLKRVARYILIYEENLAFSGYLFDKADGEPERTKEFNMPTLKKLRAIYLRVITSPQNAKELAGDVHEMENTCLETGADPL
jgi:hypothetical protein